MQNLIQLVKILKRGISSITDSGITLTNNEIKDTIKVIKSLENRGNLFKGSTTKVTSQKGGYVNFLRPLMTAGLPLNKSVLTRLAKSVVILLELSGEMSAAGAAIQKKLWVRNYSINNFK